MYVGHEKVRGVVIPATLVLCKVFKLCVVVLALRAPRKREFLQRVLWSLVLPGHAWNCLGVASHSSAGTHGSEGLLKPRPVVSPARCGQLTGPRAVWVAPARLGPHNRAVHSRTLRLETRTAHGCARTVDLCFLLGSREAVNFVAVGHTALCAGNFAVSRTALCAGTFRRQQHCTVSMPGCQPHHCVRLPLHPQHLRSQQHQALQLMF